MATRSWAHHTQQILLVSIFCILSTLWIKKKNDKQEWPKKFWAPPTLEDKCLWALFWSQRSLWTSSINLLDAQNLRPCQYLWNWNTIPWLFLCSLTLQSTELEKAHDQVLLVGHQALLILEIFMFYGPVLQNTVSQRCLVKNNISIKFTSLHRHFYGQVSLGHNYPMLYFQTCDPF